jgi:hypothetical protein
MESAEMKVKELISILQEVDPNTKVPWFVESSSTLRVRKGEPQPKFSCVAFLGSDGLFDVREHNWTPEEADDEAERCIRDGFPAYALAQPEEHPSVVDAHDCYNCYDVVDSAFRRLEKGWTPKQHGKRSRRIKWSRTPIGKSLLPSVLVNDQPQPK